MQKQHSEHVGKQLAAGIRSVLRDLNDTVQVEGFIGITDAVGNKFVVMLDGTYPQTKTLITFNGDVIGRYENFLGS